MVKINRGIVLYGGTKCDIGGSLLDRIGDRGEWLFELVFILNEFPIMVEG